jgi:hypothetical protein
MHYSGVEFARSAVQASSLDGIAIPKEGQENMAPGRDPETVFAPYVAEPLWLCYLWV